MGLVAVAALLAGGAVALAGGGEDNAVRVGALVIVLGWPLLIGLTSAITRGQTPGKRLVGLRVLRSNGRGQGFGTSLMRDTLGKGLAFIVPFGNLVNYLWPLWDSRRQALHDKLLSTQVVHTGEVRTRRSVTAGVTGGVALAATWAAVIAVAVATSEPSPPGEYTSLEREVFVDSCSEDGVPSRSTCECRFDHIARNLPHDEFEEFAERLDEDPNAPRPPEFDRAIEACP